MPAYILLGRLSMCHNCSSTFSTNTEIFLALHIILIRSLFQPPAGPLPSFCGDRIKIWRGFKTVQRKFRWSWHSKLWHFWLVGVGSAHHIYFGVNHHEILRFPFVRFHFIENPSLYNSTFKFCLCVLTLHFLIFKLPQIKTFWITRLQLWNLPTDCSQLF